MIVVFMCFCTVRLQYLMMLLTCYISSQFCKLLFLIMSLAKYVTVQNFVTIMSTGTAGLRVSGAPIQLSVYQGLGSPCTVSSPCSRSCQCQKLFLMTMAPGQQALGCQHFTETTLSMVSVWGKCCQGTFSTHHNWCG